MDTNVLKEKKGGHAYISSVVLQPKSRFPFLKDPRFQRFIIPISIVTLIIIGLTSGVYLAQQSQDTRKFAKEAAQPAAPITPSLLPTPY